MKDKKGPDAMASPPKYRDMHQSTSNEYFDAIKKYEEEYCSTTSTSQTKMIEKVNELNKKYESYLAKQQAQQPRVQRANQRYDIYTAGSTSYPWKTWDTTQSEPELTEEEHLRKKIDNEEIDLYRMTKSVIEKITNARDTIPDIILLKNATLNDLKMGIACCEFILSLTKEFELQSLYNIYMNRLKEELNGREMGEESKGVGLPLNEGANTR